MKPMRSLTVGLALSALAAAFAGCGSPSAEQGAADAAGAEQRYVQLVDRIYGTSAQRAAAEQYQFLQIQQAIAECAAGRGVKYSIPAFVGITPPEGMVSPGDLTAFAAIRQDYGVAQRHERLATSGEPANADYLKLTNAADREAYMREIEGCQSAGQPFERTTTPAGHEALASKLIETLAAVENDPVVRQLLDGYTSCLKSNGISAGSWQDLYIGVEKAFPPAPSQPTDIAKNPDWVKARDYERHAAAVDSQCRAPIRAAALVAAAPVLAEFESDNAEAVASVSAEWEKIPAQLAALKAATTS